MIKWGLTGAACGLIGVAYDCPEFSPRPVHEVGYFVLVGDQSVLWFRDVVVSGLAGCNG
jgi:hypothetical protein